MKILDNVAYALKTQQTKWNTFLSKAINMEHLNSPPARLELFRFENDSDLNLWKVYSDAEFGGKSSVMWTRAERRGIFEGNLSLEVPKAQSNQTTVKRSGFVAIKSQEKQFPSFTGFDALEMRVKSDGRIYVANIKTESNLEEDLYQAVFVPSPAKWTNVIIPFDEFILTFRGKVEYPPFKLIPERIKSFGIMMAQRKEGPFHLEIENISVVCMNQIKAMKRYTLL